MEVEHGSLQRQLPWRCEPWCLFGRFYSPFKRDYEQNFMMKTLWKPILTNQYNGNIVCFLCDFIMVSFISKRRCHFQCNLLRSIRSQTKAKSIRNKRFIWRINYQKLVNHQWDQRNVYQIIGYIVMNPRLSLKGPFLFNPYYCILLVVSS